MHSLFISDLHLDPERPAGIALFERFCTEVAPGADRLFVLGDLFEMWIGDDSSDAASDAVAAALRTLAGRGTHCHLMHGNRDFLLGDAFAQACGATLLPDPSLVLLGERRCVISHGDALCTADEQYMALRRMFRSDAFRDDMLARPLAERAAFGAEARRQSKLANGNKAENIMDVTAAEVDALLDGEAADLLVHGHTHRPAVHRWQHAGRQRTRVVLGDWHAATHYAEARDEQIRLIAWP